MLTPDSSPTATLADETDVAAALGRPLSTAERQRVMPILRKASDLFRRAARQHFTAARSTVRLKSNGGRIYLHQQPVTMVHSVVDDAENAVTYALRGNWLDTALPSDQFATVDYSHGGTVPDLVRTTVAEIVKRVLSIDPAASAGAAQMSQAAGPFNESRTYAAWAQGGQTMLAPDDRAIAESYRFRTPTVHVIGVSD